MDSFYRQRLALLSTINAKVDLIRNENNVRNTRSSLSEDAAEMYDDLAQGLLAFGLHPDNHMLSLIAEMKQNNSGNAGDEFIQRFDGWYDAQVISLANKIKTSEDYNSGRLGCDRTFREYVRFIQSNSLEQLMDYVLQRLAELRKNNPSLYEQLTVGYRGWYFEDNWLDGIGGQNNSLIHNRMTTLKNNLGDIEWLYNHLEDNHSRVVLNEIINNWLTFSSDFLKCCTFTHTVVDVNVFSFYEDEVFIDCGSYIGDTVTEYVNHVNDSYKRIYTYDISLPTVDLMKKNLASLDNIIYNVKGVGENPAYLEFAGVDIPFHGNKLVEGSEKTNCINQIEVVRLDDDVPEPITFLKIDVEGLDKEALKGAKNQITKYHPKIHVDSYHKLADFFQVPQLIYEMDPSYKFYLRITNDIEHFLYFPAPCVYAL